MKKLVKESLHKNFEKDSDPIHDMGIGIDHLEETEDLKIIKKLSKRNIPGAYVSLRGRHVYFVKDPDKVSDFLEKKFGPWSSKNSDKWRRYEIEELDERGDIDYYHY